jgi:pilus assembly protein Flp/PilA
VRRATLRNMKKRGYWSLAGRYLMRLTGCCARVPDEIVRALADESGQDLIEYALVAALIALAATASMSGVATAIGTAFTSISGHVGTYTS